MVASMSDRDAEIDRLASGAASGDAVALGQLLPLIEVDVLRIATKFLPNRFDAEEAAQDALLAVSRHIDEFDGRARFTTWLYRITANRSIDTYRRLRREWERSAGVLPADLPADRRTSVQAGTTIDLLEATRIVDDKFCEPVLLRDFCGMSYAEISIELGIAEGTVASRISEGRSRLQRVIDRW